MDRAWCGRCQSWALVVDGCLACCDSPATAQSNGPLEVRRMVDHVAPRKGPAGGVKQAILEAQGGCCAYCDRRFGTAIEFRGRLRFLRVCWDHLVPYSYSHNNLGDNFVAACQMCNGWKSNLMFQTMDDARVFLNRKWAREIAEAGDFETETGDDLSRKEDSE